MIDNVNDSATLDRTECLRLLGTSTVGRLGVTLRGLPWVVPVSYVFDGSRILVLMGSNPSIAAAARDAVVAFETDDVDPISHERWTVMATGIARDTWLGSAWADQADDGDGDGASPVLAIEPEILSGRRPAVAR
jgi:hypothetical protein